LSEKIDQEVAQEMIRQRDESKEIASIIRVIVNDMASARSVRFTTLPDELMKMSILSYIGYYKGNYDSMIASGMKPEELNPLNKIIHEATHKHFRDMYNQCIADLGGANNGNQNAQKDNTDYLEGKNLNNLSLAATMNSLEGVSVEYSNEKGFLIGRASEHFKIQVSVHEDAISLFSYFDEPYDDDEKAAIDCARYNSATVFSKAHIVNYDDYQIHFTYTYPHSGKVCIKDLYNVILKFIDEDRNSTVEFNQ